jgi:hypothetical protein
MIGESAPTQTEGIVTHAATLSQFELTVGGRAKSLSDDRMDHITNGRVFPQRAAARIDSLGPIDNLLTYRSSMGSGGLLF